MMAGKEKAIAGLAAEESKNLQPGDQQSQLNLLEQNRRILSMTSFPVHELAFSRNFIGVLDRPRLSRVIPQQGLAQNLQSLMVLETTDHPPLSTVVLQYSALPGHI